MKGPWTRHTKTHAVVASLLLAGFALLSLPGCSMRRVAVSVIGDALSGEGEVYASDDDPELIQEAMPFGLKTYESLLAVSPDHRGLLLASASGFAAYAYLIQNDADRRDLTDLPRARELRARARKLYLRSRDYALRGLEAAHPGLITRLTRDGVTALALTTKDDVPCLYWAGAAWAGALTAGKDNLDLIADLPKAGALVGRVLELDEEYDLGSAHEFFIAYEGSRPGGSVGQARQHYRRALEISGGRRASVHLALAEAVAVREQGLEEFRALLAATLAVDPNTLPHLRLANTLARRRALWLDTRIPYLFLEAGHTEEAP